jgi:hypothetical protein
MRRSLFVAVAAIAVVLSVIFAGRYAREALKERQRYSVHFADVQCESPPGMDPAAFLAEVQYLGNIPDSIYVLEPEAKKHVESAFARHPWVARVLGVDLAAKGPSVVVRLVLRRPVLVVAGRTVDASGVPHGVPAGPSTQAACYFRPALRRRGCRFMRRTPHRQRARPAHRGATPT